MKSAWLMYSTNLEFALAPCVLKRPSRNGCLEISFRDATG